jgi:hypothetical protein
MSGSRGDRKPCTHARCTGTMHFGRSSGNSDPTDPAGAVRIATTAACPDPMGWICSLSPEHFRIEDSRMLRLVGRD